MFLFSSTSYKTDLFIMFLLARTSEKADLFIMFLLARTSEKADLFIMFLLARTSEKADLFIMFLLARTSEKADLFIMFLLARTSEKAVAEQKRVETQLAVEVDGAKGRINEINVELADVVDQLGEAKVDRHESSRATKKAELIENLKRLFPGVVRTQCHWHTSVIREIYMVDII